LGRMIFLKLSAFWQSMAGAAIAFEHKNSDPEASDPEHRRADITTVDTICSTGEHKDA